MKIWLSVYFITLCRIPLSFILGFYVSQVVSRWWEQWGVIAFPDRPVHPSPMHVFRGYVTIVTDPDPGSIIFSMDPDKQIQI